MADRTISIDILANDYASSVFRNVGHGISSFASATYSGIDKANRALRAYNNSMRGFNSIVTSAMRTAGRAIYDFTTDSIKQFAELEKQHAKTMGVLSASYDFNWNGNNTHQQQSNMEQFYKDSAALKEQALKMGSVGPTGKGSLYSPDEISAAQLSLARAGITSDQMLNTDIVDTIIKFAGGNDISVDSAVAFGVQLGSQFHKKPEEWGEMFDQVTNAANMAPIDVSDVMSSLKYAGNMAAGYDVPLSDVLSAIVIMGNSGLKGSQAGSGISAIFSRGMSPTGITSASKAPTEHVEDVYNEFKSKVTDENGMFLGLGNFTDELQVAMDGLTDVELAWFNKKMFGMYQQKAALALGRSGDDTDKTFDAISGAIADNSEGINDALYDLILESSGGQIEALQNVWDTTKMRFGDALSPMTKEVTKQLISGLTNNELTIDADGLNEALDETVQRVNEQFGEYIAGLVEDLGRIGIDGSQIGLAELPLLTGYGDALVKAFTGDFPGAWQSFKDGLDATNEQIDKLPPELQDTAKNLRDLIVVFEGLFALNIVTKIAEMITSLAVLFGGAGGLIFKAIKGVFGNVNASVNTTVTSPNAVVNTNYAGVNAGQIGNATFGMIQNVASFMATTQTMTVTATSVIVNGGTVTGGNGGVGGGGNGPTLVDANGNPLTSFTNGMAQGAGFSLGAGGTAVGGALLGGAAYNMLTGGAGTAGALGAGSAPLALPAAEAAAEAGAAATGAAGASAASNVLGIALKSIGMAGNVAMLLSLSGSVANEDKQFAEYYNEGLKDGLAGKELRDYVTQRAYDTGYHNLPEDEINIYKDTSRQSAAGHWFDEQMVTMAALNNSDALQAIYDQLVNQAEYGTIDENFLNGLSIMLTDMYKDQLPTGGSITINQDIMTDLLNTLFDDEYKKPGGYWGSWADSSINEFVKKNAGNAATGWQTNGTFEQWMAALTGKLDGYEYVNGSNNVYRNTETGQQYQLTDDGALVALNGSTANMQVSAEELSKAAGQMDTSARELARQMITSGSVNVLDLGKGPLSTEGAVDYLTSLMTGNAGQGNKYGLGGNGGFMVPGILSGKDILNRFSSTMTGNAESGTSTASDNATLANIENNVSTIAAQAANSITNESMRQAFLDAFNNPENALNGASTQLQQTSISISDAIKRLSETPGWVLNLGQGPLSSEGAYNYVMQQLASGSAANSQLLQSIQNGISALDPSLTVDITNSAPIVNVDVNVKVDSTGRVISKQVLQGFGNIDNWWYRSSQRYGTTKRIER